MNQSRIKLYHVDSFTERPFSGNPAAVCIMEDCAKEQLMQNIAREMNLSETAFVILRENSSLNIRWFTPKCEVDLCGHATLAAAKILYEDYFESASKLTFHSRSGILNTYRQGEEIMLDFLMDYVEKEVQCSDKLMQALGLKGYIKAVLGRNSKKLVIHIKDRNELLQLRPDFGKLLSIDFEHTVKGVGITAAGDGEYDIVSRYFNPWAGVNEDPVTGSVHTLLASYWCSLLNKDELRAYQASARGGEMRIKLAADGRVQLWGRAVKVASGELHIKYKYDY